MNTKLNIESLIRSHLESAPVVPSPEVWEKTARALKRGRFLRFNPGRMNIYYLGIILAVTAGAGYLLLDKQAREKNSKTAVTSTEQLRNEQQAFMTDQEAEGSYEKEQAADSKNITQRNVKKSKPARIVNTTASKAVPEVGSAMEDGTSDSDSGNFILPSRPIAMFSTSCDTGCAPLTVRISNLSEYAEQYQWTFGNGMTANGATPTVQYTEAGSYLISLTVYNKQGEASSFKHQVVVLTGPSVDFDIVQDEEQVQVLNYTSGAASQSWSWKIEEENLRTFSQAYQPEALQVHTLLRTGAYVSYGESRELGIILEATAQNGCKTELTRTCSLLREAPLTFPNAFSPNPTGPVSGLWNTFYPDNTIFHPVFKDAPQQYKLRIFNRKGELVFESNDVMKGWNGYYNDAPAAGGVYIYKCEGLDSYGDSFYLQGDITLLKP